MIKSINKRKNKLDEQRGATSMFKDDEGKKIGQTKGIRKKRNKRRHCV